MSSDAPAEPGAIPAPTEAADAGHPGADTLDTEAHRRLGVRLFNHTWELIEAPDRGADGDAELVHTVHASLYHWLQAGTEVHAARGEWMCSRVYCVLGRPEPALYHAQRVLDICRRHGIGDWDLAFAYEALARAHALAGDQAAARQFVDEAKRAADDIAEEGDRKQLLSDLATVPV